MMIGGPPRPGGQRALPWGSPAPTLTDDRGAGGPVSFSETRVAAVAEPDPVHRYLWQRLATGRRFGPQTSVEPAIDALVAAGRLAVAI